MWDNAGVIYRSPALTGPDRSSGREGSRSPCVVARPQSHLSRDSSRANETSLRASDDNRASTAQTILATVFKYESDRLRQAASRLRLRSALPVRPRDLWTIGDVPGPISLDDGGELVLHPLPRRPGLHPSDSLWPRQSQRCAWLTRLPDDSGSVNLRQVIDEPKQKARKSEKLKQPDPGPRNGVTCGFGRTRHDRLTHGPTLLSLRLGPQACPFRLRRAATLADPSVGESLHLRFEAECLSRAQLQEAAPIVVGVVAMDVGRTPVASRRLQSGLQASEVNSLCRIRARRSRPPRSARRGDRRPTSWPGRRAGRPRPPDPSRRTPGWRSATPTP